MSKGNNTRQRITDTEKKACWRIRIPLDEGYPRCLICQNAKRRMHWTKHNSWHAGHIVADAKGGSPTADNLVPICPSCNSEQCDEDMRNFVKRKYPNNYSKFMATLKVHETNNDRKLFGEMRDKLWNTPYCKKENLGHIRQDTYICLCGDPLVRVDQNTIDGSYKYINIYEFDVDDDEDLHQLVLRHYPCLHNT